MGASSGRTNQRRARSITFRPQLRPAAGGGKTGTGTTQRGSAMHGKDVVLDGMSITYPNGFTAVQATDLTIAAGEFFSILGPSGCGKTTILRAVSGFLEPALSH